jgi:hypothetical protein
MAKSLAASSRHFYKGAVPFWHQGAPLCPFPSQGAPCPLKKQKQNKKIIGNLWYQREPPKVS